ncbi:MAG: F0F1 ATP synthase subunit B' [Geminicoccaceae bacterium]
MASDTHGADSGADNAVEAIEEVGAATHGSDDLIETIEHGDDAHGGGGGMPQFEAPVATQVFWLFVTFGILYWLLSSKVLPRIEAILENRQMRISDDLERAQKMRADAEKAMAEYESLINGAQDKARTLLNETQDKLEKEHAKAEADLDARLAADSRAAAQRIGAAKDEALKGLHDMATEVAQAAAEKLLGEKVTKTSAKNALKSVVSEEKA